MKMQISMDVDLMTSILKNQKLKIYLLDLIENKVQILHNGVTINDSGADYVMAGTITADMPAVGYAVVTMPEIEGNEETKAVQ